MGNKQQQSVGTGSIFDHTVETIKAPETVSLLKYKGKKAYIVVNVACQCGLTNSNYKALQEIYDKYSPDLEILAFPWYTNTHRDIHHLTPPPYQTLILTLSNITKTSTH